MREGASAGVIDNCAIEPRASSASATARTLDIEPRQQQGEFLAANAADPSDEIVPQREVARLQRALEIGAVSDVHSDERWAAAAFRLTVVPDHAEHANPRNVARKIAEDLIAVLRAERHFGIDTRRGAQQSTRLFAFDAGSFDVSTINRAIANRRRQSKRARMLRIGLLRRVSGGVACGKVLGDFA
jgi:hypothetical protein